MTGPDALGPLVVDARGMRCPWPALRLARALREASDVLLLADDAQAGREVAALADEHGWSVEDTVAASGEAGWRVRR
ncbi:tRNA 2-thiouridine synthesizing protein A [Sphingopyxis sp. YR583]|uniref:sulfurtransferase TusA family protein n=1 Tax=Sphingopyxis sp. YR583 TaxID=1881047 RepID=UPI0008A80ACE|nr:sulfurtransferase TusA family protein [Sphingopyxis sp. YR583]SEH13612.1 tRNA 2-thiouridine synthesizing protein A [Sphingopyxis sp. YR583]